MKAITRAVDEALDEFYAKGYNDGLEAACRTDNRTLCKCVSEDIKERIEYYENKDRENQAEPEGYDAGISEEEIVKNISKEEAREIILDEVRDLGYKEGLEKAWEAVKRIMLIPKNGGLSANEFRELFGSHSGWYDIFQSYTVYDVIEMLDKYDERNEIHVGDEVIFDDGEKAFVIKIYAEAHYVTVVCPDGCTKYCAIDRIKKTGNHFPEVKKLFEALRGEG